MDKWFGSYFLGKLHFSYTKNVFGINFAIVSGWSVFWGEAFGLTVGVFFAYS